MSSRPPTPPYVPFGIRRFNRISALARTVSGYCSILLGRALSLRDPLALLALQNFSSTLFELSELSTLFLLALQAWSNSPFGFLASSIVSKCTYGFVASATHPTFALLSSCLQSRSNPAIHGCRLLHLPSLSGHFCPDYGKSVLSVWLWLSSRTLRVLECRLHSCPSLTKSPET